jgi:hypothetical protein
VVHALTGYPVPSRCTGTILKWGSVTRGWTLNPFDYLQRPENNSDPRDAKTVQTLMGHHSVAFTMDQYVDAWPEQIANAGEAAAKRLFPQVLAKR